MKVTCKSNNLSDVQEKVRRFAFMQDNQGIVPLTVGQQYTVYGFRQNRFGKFVFVVRDEERLPWWMPEGLFSDVPPEIPKTWKTEEYLSDYTGQEIVSAPQAYFGNEEEIEDGEPKGYEAFAQMQNDSPATDG